MARHFCVLLSTVLALGISPGVSAQEQPKSDSITFSGVVVDSADNPIPYAVIGAFWGNNRTSDGEVILGTFGPINESFVTDKDGRFEARLDRKYGLDMTVFGPKYKLAARIKISDEEAKNPIKIVLEPVGKIKAHLSINGFPEFPITCVLNMLDPVRGRYGQIRGVGDIEIPVIPGKYQVWLVDNNAKPYDTFDVEVNPHETLDLGKLVLEPTNFIKKSGQEPLPWTILDARGINKDIQLKDFKGKWVIIDFWGYW